MTTNIKPGDKVWAVSRKSVRAGKGPRRITVTEVKVIRYNNGDVSHTTVWAGRSLYWLEEIHLTKEDAAAAVNRLASEEWTLEAGRFQAFCNKLEAARKACK